MWPFYSPTSPSSGNLPVPRSGFSLADLFGGNVQPLPSGKLPVRSLGRDVGGLGQMVLKAIMRRPGSLLGPYSGVADAITNSTPANQGEVPQYVKSPYGYIRNSADTSTLAKPANNAGGADETGMAMSFPGVPMPRPRPAQMPMPLAPPAQGQAPFNLDPFKAAPMGGPGSMSFGAGDGPSGNPQDPQSDLLSMLIKKMRAQQAFGQGSSGAIY